MRTVLIALAIAAVAAPASATEWWWMTTTKDRDVVFLDRDSIVEVPAASRKLVMARTQVIRKFNTAGSAAPQTYLSYFVCNGHHTGEGSLIFNDPDPAPPTAATIAAKELRLAPAAAGTGDPEKLKYACNVRKIIEGEPYYSNQGSDFYAVTDLEGSAAVYQSYFDRAR